ncbi:MAG: hypothetical protein R2823_09125 [Acidimicrobiia bacterium]
MEAIAAELRASFVGAYPAYVSRWFAKRRITPDEMLGDAVVAGTQQLDRLLSAAGETPIAEQRRGPLELFADGLRPVARALAHTGIDPLPVGQRSRLQDWDVYGLAPGSSQVLGERAHAAHLAWGVARASAAGVGVGAGRRPPERPAVQVVCRDADAGRIAAALTAAGYRIARDDAVRVVVVLVDVDIFPDSIATLVDSGRRVLAYGDSVNDLTSPGWHSAGVWRVASRARVLEQLSTLLPGLA